MSARRIALYGSLAYLVAHALASSYVLEALWDWRVFQDHWFDHAWELELVYRARLGEWSGRDFHYPRGPLWQLVAYLASQPWRPLEAARTLAGIDRAFHLGALAMIAWIVARRVRGDSRRLIALWAIAVIGWAAGVPSARALISACVILLYLPPDGADEPSRWRRPAIVAAVVVGALLLSFDRFAVAGLSLAALSITELVHRAIARDRPREAALRSARTLAAIVVALALVGLVGLALGADPFEYVEGQRGLAAGYATGMRTPWYVGVPPANIVALWLCGAGLVVAGLARRWPGRHVAWIAGALPAALFGVITSDAGHMVLAILPLLVVLVVVSADAGGAPWMRGLSGLLAAVGIVGWLGAYPSALSVNPRAFVEALDVVRGLKQPDRGFSSDHAAAVGVTRQLAAEERPACVALWPSLTVAHALADVPGPTQLALRWSEPQQRALAARIEAAGCPLYVHDLGSFDAPGGAWMLGPDLVTLIERYAPERQVGPGLVVMRARERPVALPRFPVGSPAAGVRHAVRLPGELRIPLDEELPGDGLLELTYRLEVPAWRAQLGGAPWGEWRFERAGEALGEWRPLHHLSASDAPITVFLSPDPEAFERGWATRERVERDLRADALRVRLRPGGPLSPAEVGLTVVGLTRFALPDPPPAPVGPACVGEVDLLARLRERRASPRNSSPRTSALHFHLDRNLYPFPDAEVFFAARPCEDACFSAMVAARGADDVELEVHALRADARPRLARVAIPGDGQEVPVEVPLDRFVGQAQWLRLGVPSGPSEAFVTVAAPRLIPCSARRWIAEALADGAVEVARGEANADGRDVTLPEGDARLRFRVRVADATCLGVGFRSEASAPARTQLRVWVDGVGHVLHDAEGPLGPSATGFVVGLHDFAGREAILELEIRPERAAPTRLLGPHLYRCVE